MPYPSNQSLPPSIKSNLPGHAQTIYRKAFNSAVKQGYPETTCFKVAWSAVKKVYTKSGDKWTKKSLDDISKSAANGVLQIE